MDKNKRSMILKSGAFLTALVATGLVNNGVSADQTDAPTGPTDNATVATGHSDTLLPPASSTPATPGTNTTDVPTAEAEVPKVDSPKNEGVATVTPKVTDGSTGTGVATPTTPSVSTPSQDEGKTSENSEATPTTSENASTTAETSTATSEGSKGNATSDTTSTASETPAPSEHTVTETPTKPNATDTANANHNSENNTSSSSESSTNTVNDKGSTVATPTPAPTEGNNASSSEAPSGSSTSAESSSTSSETPKVSDGTSGTGVSLPSSEGTTSSEKSSTSPELSETATSTPHILDGTIGTGVSTPTEHKSDNRTEVASTSAATSNKVVESPKTEEAPKVSNTNVQETPKPGDVSPSTKQVVLNVTPSQPVVTNTGYKVVSTNNSDLVVQNFDGSVASVPASQAGGAVNEDGTVSVKTEAGEMVTLPETGETGTKLVTFGFLILAALGLQRTAVKQDKWYSN